MLSESEITADDLDETMQLLNSVPEVASTVLETIQNVIKQVKKDEFQGKGLSFLDMKNQMMLSYVTNLTYIILKKISGQKIEGEPAIERLVELRTTLEKIRPIDEKLKYQINKLVSTASSGTVDANDPLRFRANPDNLAVPDEEEDTADEPRESKIYVPPKISAAYYDEDESLTDRKKRILERAQRKALSSTMLQELRKEYDTGPEEIRETVDPYKLKLTQEMKERERYEEEYMLRLPMTKRQRHEARQLTTVTNFSTKFEDISALEMNLNDVSMKRRSSGPKGKFSKNKKKKGFKRKKH
ncbi:neuroguidin-A-like [Uloborus diversus]|uniref:neuroguidin-A-like n=1 Tax=Uloborus diversus TaxID=327109 RepID=UPI002409BCC1|nr:neuroguidin-A-like [Uloborus diversus]